MAPSVSLVPKARVTSVGGGAFGAGYVSDDISVFVSREWSSGKLRIGGTSLDARAVRTTAATHASNAVRILGRYSRML